MFVGEDINNNIHLITALRAGEKGYDIWLSKLAQTSIQELEQERRVFYVAITRAKEQLLMMLANKGSIESRYIEEMDL